MNATRGLFNDRPEGTITKHIWGLSVHDGVFNTGSRARVTAVLWPSPCCGKPHSITDRHLAAEPDFLAGPRQKARRAEREHRFEAVVKNPAYKDHIIIFTGELAELWAGVCVTDLGAESRSNADWEVRITAASVNPAQEARRPFLSIVLTCDLEENINRIATEERKQSSTTRLTDSGKLRSKRKSEVIYKFDAESECILGITELKP